MMEEKEKNVLVTGGAGFIGSHLCETLLSEGNKVTVIDNLDPYYSIEIKKNNLSILKKYPGFTFIEIDICNSKEVFNALPESFDCLVHIASKAGVRSSILDPESYLQVNLIGTKNMLEFAKVRGIKQVVFSSSSSVYGNHPDAPWKESNKELLPISPYASSKLSAESIGHVYSHLYNIRFIALRFFTVYGPRQRPDLAIYKFTKNIMEGHEIPVYGDGSTKRDYTYVKDIVQGIIAAMDYNMSEYEIINLGNNRTISLSDMIKTIEEVVGKKAIINRLGEQAGDVKNTEANIEKAGQLLGYSPKTNFKEGIEAFYKWLKND